MKISLENFLRNHLQELEENHEYSIGTDSVRALIDLYNERPFEPGDIVECEINGRGRVSTIGVYDGKVAVVFTGGWTYHYHPDGSLMGDKNGLQVLKRID